MVMASSPLKIRLSKLVYAVLGSVLLALPRAAAACSVCMSGREDENRLAFILTTVFLTFLPLTLIGASVLWIRRKSRDHERRHARGLPASIAGPIR